jgi:hypothetical protein
MKPMIDEHYADRALAFLKEIYLRKGTDAAVEAAKDMISAGAAWIAQESGADEARRIHIRTIIASCIDFWNARPSLARCPGFVAMG